MAFVDQTRPTDPDPALTAILDAGRDDGFLRGIDRAHDLLDRPMVHGFWLQGVGDGTVIEALDPDGTDGRTPHQLVHVQGYADDLDYPTIQTMARTFFAHHVGILTDPTSKGLPLTEIMGDIESHLVRVTATLFGDEAGRGDYPRNGSLAEHRNRAHRLLDLERLTSFWLQVMVVDEDSRQLITNSPTYTPEGIAVLAAHPIEYIAGIPDGLDMETYLQIIDQYQAHHLAIATGTADDDVEPFVRDACQMAVDHGFVYEFVTPV